MNTFAAAAAAAGAGDASRESESRQTGHQTIIVFLTFCRTKNFQEIFVKEHVEDMIVFARRTLSNKIK